MAWMPYVSALCTAVGFAMPIPQVYNASKTFIKNRAIREVLIFFLGENYDEAIHRKLSDKVNRQYHNLSQFLMAFGLVWDVLLFAAGGYTSTAFRGWILFQTYYNVLFYYRMGDATDSDIEGHFPHLGQKFYLYYPLIDERKDFTRSIKMQGRNELNSKGTQLEHSLRVDLFRSTMLLFAWATWALITHHLVGSDGLPYWKAAIYALFPTFMMAKNWGLVRFIDSFQRYIFMTTLRLPLKEISSNTFFSSHAAWNASGKLPKAAYNLYNSWFTPVSVFTHKNVYNKLRSKDYKMTIGQSMAVTALVRASALMSVFWFMQAGMDEKDKSVLDVSKNTVLLSSTLLIIGYLLHAHLLWRYEDHSSFTKSIEYQRNSKTQEGVFFGHQLATVVSDHFLFTTPLVYTAFQAVQA